MTISEIIKHEHPYYATGNGFNEYGSFDSFLEQMSSADTDLNLCYRWDVVDNGNGTYGARIYTILQRKGRIWEHHIRVVTDDDIPKLIKFLQPHVETLQKIWMPFSLHNEPDDEVSDTTGDEERTES